MDPGLDLELLWIQPLLANDFVLPVWCCECVEAVTIGLTAGLMMCMCYYYKRKYESAKEILENLTKRSKQELEEILLLSKEAKENPKSLALDEIIRKTNTLLQMQKDAAARLNTPVFTHRLQSAWNVLSNSSGHEKLAVQLLFTEQLSSREVRSSLKTCLQKWARRSTDFCSHDAVSSIDESKPLLVVCLSVSRMDSDIDNGLSKLTLTDDMRQQRLAVLMLHLCGEGSLPQLPTSTHIGNDSKYADITFIDVAYDNEFYNCEMNNTAKDALNKFLERCRSKILA